MDEGETRKRKTFCWRKNEVKEKSEGFFILSEVYLKKRIGWII